MRQMIWSVLTWIKLINIKITNNYYVVITFQSFAECIWNFFEDLSFIEILGAICILGPFSFGKVSSIQTDSVLELLQWDNFLAAMPSRKKTIFSTAFRISTFSKYRTLVPINVELAVRKALSSLVLSVQSISILDAEMMSLKQVIFLF